MSFASADFLILFFPVCILLNYLMKEQYRNMFLLVMSVFFYFWCGIRFLLLILFSATLAYVWGRLIERTKNEVRKKLFLVIGIAIQLGFLFYYKYFFDLFSVVSPWLTGLLTESSLFTLDSPMLPLGISFYTFSILSYLLDIYWGVCDSQKSIFIMYLYVLFFPKVVQGPIMRFADFEIQLQNRTVNLENLNDGMERFCKGIVKKVMIADNIQLLAIYSFTDIYAVGTIPAWIGIISYMLQLYYDFSGYSDMAIGIGKMVGFSLPENFDHPYMSSTVSEYWRRWHISLGNWFKDYVYTPCIKGMATSEWCKKLKHPLVICDILALIVTWTLTGIWHGSGLRFLIYGIWYCAFIIFERLQNNRHKKLKKQGKLETRRHELLGKTVNHLVTIFAIVFGTILFRADSLRTALVYMKKLVIWNTADGLRFFHQFDNYLVFILIVAILFVFPIYEKLKVKILKLCSIYGQEYIFLTVYRLGLLAAFFVAFCYAVGAGYTSFLYEVF